MYLTEYDERWFINCDGAVISVKAVNTLIQHMPNNGCVIKVLYEQHRSDTFGLLSARRVVEFVQLAKQLAAL